MELQSKCFDLTFTLRNMDFFKMIKSNLTKIEMIICHFPILQKKKDSL
jgi:hypothetical protein